MPRRPRLHLTGLPLHVIQRGNNRAACFFAAEDYRFYLHWLGIGAKKHGCAIHAYALMTNHVHLLMTPDKPDAASALMQSMGRRYVQYVNRFYKRSGTLWEGRFKASLVDAEAYLLKCHRYIELNPVRAGMVKHPGEYPWSSYAVNGQGAAGELLTPHALYAALGHDKAQRLEAYRALFRSELDEEDVDAIRQSTNKGLPLGNKRFAAEVEAALGRKVLPVAKGRPKAGQGGIDGEQTGFGF